MCPLGCTDIGLAVLAMYFRLYEDWNGGWDLGKWLCLIVNIFDGMLCMASMCNLYTLVLERYLDVCRPFLHMKIRNWTIAVILTLCWLAPIALWSAMLLSAWHVIGIEDLVGCVTESACPLLLNITASMVVTTGTFWIFSVLMILPMVLKSFTIWLAYMNSIVNPFLYYIFNQQVKMAFKNSVRSKGERHEDLNTI
ncbi:5-hydroxytryptamine receptor 4-like [Gigantopelta aegis]|uniref:5-hydroxytryptamine receptor 4-like n=1 Tax=Gigantopelta aegis TaxID=1735272 RepID=UPI001B88AA6A|nr:5-hydroxytryptamine receptor 4-like [Gigantopelta aegis]